MSNKITEISEQIKALKDITFSEIFTQQLKASKIPFPEKFEHYIEQLIENAQFTQNSKLKVLSADKQSDGWHIDLMGQPFSYIELDNEHYNFPANGRMDIVIPLKESEPFFVAKYTWLPYDEAFEASYTKPQDDQYFNSIINSVSFPEKQDKGTIEVGYLIGTVNKDQLLFIGGQPSIFGTIDNGYTIQGLLPEFTFTVGNKEFTSDSSGTITITTKEVFEIVNAYNEQRSTLPVVGKYNGILKDHIVKEDEASFEESYNFLELDAFKPSDSSNSTYYNRTNVPLEIEYLGETSTIPVDGSKEFNITFNTVEQLKTIKANATDKFKIKNTFNYPWNKEFTIDRLTSILDKDLFVNYIMSGRGLDVSIEALGQAYDNTNDYGLYSIYKGNDIGLTKEYLKTIPANATELGITIKDTFDYPWKTFIKCDTVTQTILDKDYLINQIKNNQNKIALTTEALGKTFNDISSAYSFINSNIVTPSKEFLETVDEHTTELGVTIKDEFTYPWKKFLHIQSFDKFLDKNYIINNYSIYYSTYNDIGYYFRGYPNYSYTFNNKELALNSSYQTVISYKDIYNYLKNKNNSTLSFTVNINSNYYNKTINIDNLINFNNIINKLFYVDVNNKTVTNKAGIKKLKAYTNSPNDGIVYTLPEEETFSYYNLLSTELKFKNKFNDVSNTYLNIADDDCTNSLFLSQYVTAVTSNMLAKELCFNNLSPNYSDEHQKLSLNLSSDFSDLKQYIVDHYEVVTGNGNKYNITETSDGFIIDDKIKNEMLFAGDGLTISLIHKNDTNNEFIKKENETIYSYNITGNTNLATSIYRNLETLNKVYDNTKNGFNFEEIPITRIIIDTPSSSETAADLQISDINKFTGMKTLYYADKVNNIDIKKIIDSNEIITAINSMKYYRDISDDNGHIIINYNTESESNKVFDINIGINVIYGIIYGYNVDNLKDKL
ncbi:MAG: hypothetical protein HG453_004825 [Clostridiales bacterium]|nr:hypothetical protein [Clostridiales bacterium]